MIMQVYRVYWNINCGVKITDPDQRPYIEYKLFNLILLEV